MMDPFETALEACYQVAQAIQEIKKIDDYWITLYNDEFIFLHHGDIQNDDYQEMLPLCIDVLGYSLKQQTDPDEIAWHKYLLGEASEHGEKLDTAKQTILRNVDILDTEPEVFAELVKVYGDASETQVVNAEKIGKWETHVRVLMERHQISHEEVAIYLILDPNFQ